MRLMKYIKSETLTGSDADGMKEVFSLRITLVLLLVLLTVCFTRTISQPLTHEQVVTALQEDGLHFGESEVDENVTYMDTNGVTPSLHLVEGSSLFIFIFQSDNERRKGRIAFHSKPICFVPYITYEVKNVLIIHMYNDSTMQQKIEAALSKLE